MLVLRRTLPVDNVGKPPGILVQLDLQLTVLVDGELASRVQDAPALALILIVQLHLTCGQIERLRLGI